MTSTESSENVSHVVVCLNEIKMGVIAKAAVYPGANTLIMNLLSSFSDEDADEEAQVDLTSIHKLRYFQPSTYQLFTHYYTFPLTSFALLQSILCVKSLIDFMRKTCIATQPRLTRHSCFSLCET